MSNSKYLTIEESFNADKLAYLINNFDSFKDLMRPSVFNDGGDPLHLAKKYLEKSRHGLQVVNYRQRNSKGRYYAIGQLSLQTLCREIRHTISSEYYNDIDMVNAHPVFLNQLCKKHDFPCKSLDEYIQNRETLLKELNIDRELAKKVYLSLLNGGNKDYQELNFKSEHVKKFKKEMKKIHKYLATIEYKNEFNIYKQKREEEYKLHEKPLFNLEGGFVHCLLEDIENNCLMALYNHLQKPKNCVLCFDGIMLPKTMKIDLQSSEKAIEEETGYRVSLKKKTMNEGFELPRNIPKHEYFSLDTFIDFEHLVQKKYVYKEWVDEWINNNVKVIYHNNVFTFLTKQLTKQKMIDNKTPEVKSEWKFMTKAQMKDTLDCDCLVVNPFFDKQTTPGDDCENRVLFHTLGYGRASAKTKTKGVIQSMEKSRTFDSYNKIDFYPYLKRLGPPNISERSFNLFTGFPLEDADITFGDMKAEDLLVYKHWRDELCDGDLGLFNYFLDFLADALQDPATIKGPSLVFYSKQGVGKEVTITTVLKRLFGKEQVAVIQQLGMYFSNKHNDDVVYKLFKIFEELEERGSGHKWSEKIKGEQTKTEERVEPKYHAPFSVKHFSRYIYYTNNENAMYLQEHDRRFTLIRCNNRYANNTNYFSKLVEELKKPTVLKCLFEFLANRKYDKQRLYKPYETVYKNEQKINCLRWGIKIIIDFIEENFNKIEDKNYFITSKFLEDYAKTYCQDNSFNFRKKDFRNHLKEIGVYPTRKQTSSLVRPYVYCANPDKILKRLRRHLNSNDFDFTIDSELQNVNLSVYKNCSFIGLPSSTKSNIFRKDEDDFF